MKTVFETLFMGRHSSRPRQKLTPKDLFDLISDRSRDRAFGNSWAAVGLNSRARRNGSTSLDHREHMLYSGPGMSDVPPTYAYQRCCPIIRLTDLFPEPIDDLVRGDVVADGLKAVDWSSAASVR